MGEELRSALDQDWGDRGGWSLFLATGEAGHCFWGPFKGRSGSVRNFQNTLLVNIRRIFLCVHRFVKPDPGERRGPGPDLMECPLRF